MKGEWVGKRVIVIGAARQGLALARYLLKNGARVILNDQQPFNQLEFARQSLEDLGPDEIGRLTWACGGHPLELLDEADLVCPSGGVPLTLPLIVEARRRGVPLSNDSQIFLEVCPCRVIGITGSAGKTTTTTLIGRMANAWSNLESSDQPGLRPFDLRPVHQVWVGGNIGLPLLSKVDQMRPDDLAVMELSSFQLEIMSRSMQVAVVLNITPNHLDRHETMEAYTAAKARIVDCQTERDVAVLCRDDAGAWGLAGRVSGQLVSFGLTHPPHGQVGTYVQGEDLFWWDGRSGRRLLPVRLIALRGQHNLLNVLAACAACAAAGVSVEAMGAGLQGFHGVPHRLEFVARWGGAAWYNDSIATTPERAMAAIRTFDEPIILLAGGRDKKLPWEDFAILVRQRVDHLIVFGEAAEKIARAVERTVEQSNDTTRLTPASERPYTIERCQGLREAVQAAARLVEPGDVVLLAPGGTSFDEFRDFEARGEAFRRWVLELS